MKSNIEKALEFVLIWEVGPRPKIEGGYTNDPDDPGGETKWGISKRAYPDLDIANLTLEDAIEIYRKDYWNPCNCDNLDWPLACAVFDTAVNCGVKRAKLWLGYCKLTDSYDLNYFMNLRIMHYIQISDKNPSLKKYKKGWMNRVNDLKKYIEINNT